MSMRCRCIWGCRSCVYGHAMYRRCDIYQVSRVRGSRADTWTRSTPLPMYRVYQSSLWGVQPSCPGSCWERLFIATAKSIPCTHVSRSTAFYMYEASYHQHFRLHHSRSQTCTFPTNRPFKFRRLSLANGVFHSKPELQYPEPPATPGTGRALEGGKTVPAPPRPSVLSRFNHEATLRRQTYPDTRSPFFVSDSGSTEEATSLVCRHTCTQHARTSGAPLDPLTFALLRCR